MQLAPTQARRPRRAAVVLAFFLGALLTACGSAPEPYVANPTARGIVASYAESAFGVWFDLDTERGALERFQAATADAATKAELAQDWQAEPELAAQGADFLERQVFAKATADGDWPAEGNFDEKHVYVGGTRDGLGEVLAAEGE